MCIYIYFFFPGFYEHVRLFQYIIDGNGTHATAPQSGDSLSGSRLSTKRPRSIHTAFPLAPTSKFLRTCRLPCCDNPRPRRPPAICGSDGYQTVGARTPPRDHGSTPPHPTQPNRKEMKDLRTNLQPHRAPWTRAGLSITGAASRFPYADPFQRRYPRSSTC